MIDVRVLDEDELRTSNGVFRAAMHHGAAEDKVWEVARRSYAPGRSFGAYVGGVLAGTTMSFAMPMTVPGGAVLPSSAVTRVGVRADHRRRGVLTAVMREQLRATEEPIASLRASEYPIYGRFGYGVATRGRSVEIQPKHGRYHPAAPAGGEVRLVDRDDVQKVIPELYAKIAGELRPGALHRSEGWWDLMLNRPDEGDHPKVAVVHSGPDGDDGFAVYRGERNATPEDPWGLALTVEDLHATNVAATAGLWRFVLGVDLTNLVRGWLRPLDEPLELLVADPRECRTRDVSDEAWLRLVDVPAALSARSWAGTDAVVLRVRDALLPANDGAYRISPDGVTRTDDEPELECDVAILGRLYLGDLAPSALAATGWLTVNDANAPRTADALFATSTVPWSGTFF